MNTRRFLFSSALAVGFLASGAFSPVRAADPYEINLCTGGEGGPYHQAGLLIAAQAQGSTKLKINVIADTGGTWGNIERTTGAASAEDFSSGRACHAFIGQPDGPVLLSRQNAGEAKKIVPVAKLHWEYLHVLCGKDSGVEDLTDLEGLDGASVALGSSGSGAWLVWQNFVYEDSGYGTIATKPLGDIDAVSSVASGDTTCALVPAALGNKTVREADELFGKDLVLAGATDWDFNDAVDIKGDRLYDFAKIPSGTYPTNLQGWFSGAKTVRWQAQVYVNTERFTDSKAKTDFIRAVARARPEIVATFGGE